MLLIKNYHILCKLGNGETHWGHHRGHQTPLNINIYPSTLFFFENIGHKYDFEDVWGGVGWRGVVQLKENKLFPPNKFMFTYYRYLEELSNQINDGFN